MHQINKAAVLPRFLLVHDMYTLSVFVTPRASMTEAVHWDGSTLNIRVAAAPVEGHVNNALILFLAKYFDISLSQIHLLRGHRSRKKIILLPLSETSVRHIIQTNLKNK